VLGSRIYVVFWRKAFQEPAKIWAKIYELSVGQVSLWDFTHTDFFALCFHSEPIARAYLILFSSCLPPVKISRVLLINIEKGTGTCLLLAKLGDSAVQSLLVGPNISAISKLTKSSIHLAQGRVAAPQLFS